MLAVVLTCSVVDVIFVSATDTGDRSADTLGSLCVCFLGVLGVLLGKGGRGIATFLSPFPLGVPVSVAAR